MSLNSPAHATADSRTPSSWRILAPFVLVSIVCAAGAPTIIHRSDNFNNNALAAYWTEVNLGNADLNETNGRIEFNNTGPTGVVSSAGIFFEPYGINWKRDFHIEFTYRLNINNLNAPREFFMGTALAVEGDFPQTMTGLAAGLLRDSTGLYVGVFQYDNGEIVASDVEAITQKTGKIEIDWDRSLDQMTVERSNSGGEVELNGYFADVGGIYGNDPMRITQAIATHRGNINFVGSNIYMDNWEADFYRRNIP